MRLTKPAVAKLAVPLGKDEILVFDDDLPGFGVRVRFGGKRTWIVQYRMGAKQRRVSLGPVSTLELDEARRRAKATLAKVHLGLDPQAEKREVRVQASITLAVVAKRYLEFAELRLKPRSLGDVRRYLTRHWSPLAESPIGRIQRATISARLLELKSLNGDFAANRARAALSAMFSWAMGEGLAEANPVIGTHRPAEEISRDRVLTDEELALVWRHAGEGDFGKILRLLILTGQRREEVGGMLWSELQLDRRLWSIGAQRTKNGLPHDVPLSEAALAIVGELSRRDERDLVFGSRQGPFQGWSKSKATLDGAMLDALRERHGAKAKLTPWRIHDIRRTVSTRMSDLGVLPHVVEAVLNHISGHRAGVAGVYNRATYAAEKREALVVWANRVGSVVEGDVANVGALDGGKARP